jgi:hypothetical protein
LIAKEDHYMRRKISEAIEIKKVPSNQIWVKALK